MHGHLKHSDYKRYSENMKDNPTESVIKTNTDVCFPSKDSDLKITSATSIQTVIKSLASLEAEKFYREQRVVPVSGSTHSTNPFMLRIIFS